MKLDLLQGLIDRVSDALMRGDFDAYMNAVDTPLALISEKGAVLITDREQFRMGFEAYAGKLRTEGATDLIRLAHGVTEYSPNLITGRYETHVMRGGTRIYGPFSSALSARRVGDGWRINSIVSPGPSHEWPINRVFDAAAQARDGAAGKDEEGG